MFFSVSTFIRQPQLLCEAVFPSVMMLCVSQIANVVVQERYAGKTLTTLYGTKFQSLYAPIQQPRRSHFVLRLLQSICMLKCFQPRNVCFACRGIVLLSASVSCPDGKIVAKPTLLPLLRWVLDERTFEEAEYLLVCAVANEISLLRKGRIVLSAL